MCIRDSVAGITGADYIVAINKDEDASIFDIANVCLLYTSCEKIKMLDVAFTGIDHVGQKLSLIHIYTVFAYICDTYAVFSADFIKFFKKFRCV